MNSDFLPRHDYRHGNRSPLRPGSSTANNWRQRHAFQPQAAATQQASAHSESQQSIEETPKTDEHTPKPPKKSLKERLKSLSKKQWIIIGVVSAIVLTGIGFAVYSIFIKEDPKPVQKVVKKEVPKPKPIPLVSALTGLPITDKSLNERPITGVMIENSPDARPQAGLNQAGIVFEAVAEGGITRFLTLFQETEPDHLGPVRSVRPYYVQWLMGFDAGIAHAGGSADALNMIRTNNVRDLDQFANTGPYWRVNTRYAPHNLYTNVTKLRELQAKKGWGKSNFTGFARKKEAVSAQPNAKAIDFKISSALYNTHYDYDAASNSYKRSLAGKPHVDEKTGAQLSPKVVIGLVLPQGRNNIYTTYNTLGSGEVFIFQDGIVTKGTWHKADNKANFTFKDEGGNELKLNPGQTWLTAIGGSDRVSFTQ